LQRLNVFLFCEDKNNQVLSCIFIIM
jgi:hypothetical protein